MKKLLMILSTLLLIACQTPVPPHLPVITPPIDTAEFDVHFPTLHMPQAVLDYYNQNTWVITNDMAHGTAFHITPNLLITNAHVLTDQRPPRMIARYPYPKFYLTRDGEQFEMVVEAVNEDDDLALLSCALCDTGDLVESTLITNTVQFGYRAFGGGHGLGRFSVHTGFIQSSDDYFTWTDVPLTEGDSGSPQIILDSNDKVFIVGIRTAVMQNTGGQSVNHKGRLIKSSVLLRWLASIGLY